MDYSGITAMGALRANEQARESYAQGYADAMEAAANVATAIDSNRGNEKEIATTLREEAKRVRDTGEVTK